MAKPLTEEEKKRINEMLKAAKITEKAQKDLIRQQLKADKAFADDQGLEFDYASALEKSIKEAQKLTAPAVTGEFKPVEEKKVEAAAPPITLPLPPGEEPTLTTVLRRQQIIPEERAKRIKTFDVDFEKMTQALEKSGLEPVDAKRQSSAIQEAYLEYKKINKDADPQAAINKTIEEISAISEAPTLKEEKVGSKDPYIRAFSQQVKEGEIPDYTPTQLAFLKSLNKQRVDNYVEKNIDWISKTANKYREITLKTGKKVLVPDEVYRYLKESTLPPVVFNETLDKMILEGDAAFTTRLNPKETETDYKAIAKVKAYQELGGDEWFLDPEKKKKVLEDPKQFERGLVVPGLGETEGGWIFEKTTPLGGTAESTGAWLLRSTMTPYNLVAGTVTEVTSTEELKRLKDDQRAKQTPLYKDSPILANVALNKGFTGEAQEAADALRVEDPLTRLTIVGGGFATDLLDPTTAITAGAGKATKTAVNLRKAQKAIYGGTNTKQIASAATKAFTSELLDDVNLISMTTQFLPKETRAAIKGASHGDIRLHLADDLSRSLDAKRVVESAADEGTAIRALQEKGLDTTTYSTLLKKRIDEDGFEAAKLRMREQMAPSNESRSLLAELDDTQRVLDDIDSVGKSKALQNADELNLQIKPRFIDEVLRAADGDIARAKDIASKHYARAVVFEETPNVKSLENIVAVTRNTWAHKDKVGDILAGSIQTPLGRELVQISGKAKTGIDVKPPEFSYGAAYQAGARKAEGVPTRYFKLSKEQQAPLLQQLQELPIREAQKEFIADTIQRGKLYADDHRLLIDANVDRFALGDGIAKEDISRLPAAEQERLFEPVGAAQRVTGISDIVKDLYSSASKKILKKQNKLSMPNTIKDTSFEQRRIIKEVQQESSTLDTKAKRDVDGLTRSEEARSFYVDDPENPMDRMEALGAIIIGPKQKINGVNRQQEIVAETLEWSFGRLFFEKKEFETVLDSINGTNKLYDNDLLNQTGKDLLRKDIAAVSQQMTQNPRQFWTIFNEFLNDWAAKVSSGVVDGERIVKTNIRPKSIEKIVNENLQKVQADVGLGMFFNAESTRIRDRALVKVVDGEFTPTTVKDIFPEGGVSQEQFQDAVKQSILSSYNRVVPYSYKLDILKTQGVPDDVARKAIEYGNTITRKNNLNDFVDMDVAGMRGMIDDLFGGDNESFARAVFGTEYYDQINSAMIEGRASSLTANLDELLRAATTKQRGWYAVKKLLNQIAAFRYTALLAMRPRFHGSNVITANAIMYSTIGQMIGPKYTKKGFDVAFFASTPGSKLANQIAVTTPSGKTYSYDEIFDAVRVSGVRSELNFVTTVINDGSLIKWLKRHDGTKEGFGSDMMRWIQDAPDKLNDFTMQEDMVFRAGAMIKSLEEGSSIEEATALARRSLFDYNDMSAAEKSFTGYFFVFWSFTRQNMATLIKSLDDPKMFNRYVNVLKFDRGVEALAAELNDGKKFPHQAFFPDYTMSRQVLSVQKGQSKDWYAMGPPIPAIDAIMMTAEIAQSPTEAITRKFLSPEFKALFGLESTFKGGKRIPSEYINLISATYSKDPEDIANLIEKVVGGEVVPTLTSEEKGAVGGYTYELSKEQQDKWNTFSKWALDFPGLSTPAKDWSKVFFTEGTSYQDLSPAERLLATTGAITPTGIAAPEQQDIYQLRARKRAVDERIRQLKSAQRKRKEQKRKK